MSEITRNAPQSLLSKRGIKQRLFSFTERYVLGRTRHLIAISPYVINITKPYTSAETHMVENPIRECFFNANAKPDTGSYFLFVGGVEPLKGVDYLIDAFAQLVSITPDNTESVRLVIVGPDTNKAFSLKLRAKITRLGLGDQIDFKGFMFPDELADIYKKAACLVLPSLQETAPMCIAEAMSAGLPVIASSVGGIPHMVDDGRTGLLVPPKDPHLLANAMHLLWSRPEKRLNMGKAGHKDAINRWEQDVIALRTVNVYRDVLKSAN